MTTSKINTIEEIKDILSDAGAAFTGGFPESCEGLAEEWNDEFDGDTRAIRNWVEAGYWDAATARKVADAGYTPRHAAAYADGRDADGVEPIYALCNGDVTIGDLVWS